MYAIEKNVPYGERSRTRYNGSKYPLTKMDVGDSITVPTELERNRILNSVNDHKRFGKLPALMKFSSRRLNTGEYRIWRLA